MMAEDGRKGKRQWGYRPSDSFVNSIADAIRMCNEQREEITQLKANLAKFGGHRWDCPAHGNEHGFYFGGKCDCGWAELEVK